MSSSIARGCRHGSSDAGIATTAEYALLAGVSVAIFLALSGAMGTFFATARGDATAIAAYQVAFTISSATCDATGTGDVSTMLAMDLPEQICGMPYLAYPSPDGRNITIDVVAGQSAHRYSVPLPLRAGDVSVCGFIASPPRGHTIVYDASSRTVTLS